jgi:hypothetical protein
MFFVVCTFDLKNATYTDYQNAYADLAKLGLNRAVVSDQGKNVVAPTTTAMGTYNGQSTATVRDHVRTQVQDAFRARGFKSEIFVVVGSNSTWGAGQRKDMLAGAGHVVRPHGSIWWDRGGTALSPGGLRRVHLGPMVLMRCLSKSSPVHNGPTVSPDF